MPFVWGTLIGALPQNVVFVLIGSGARLGHGFQTIAGILLFVASGALGITLLRQARQARAALQATGTLNDDKKVN